MKVIGDLLTRNLQQKIEEIIKVDQTDEQTVYTEISEYVATDRIRSQYHELFRAIAEAPQIRMKASASDFRLLWLW